MADNVLAYPAACLTRVPRWVTLFSVLRALVQVAVSDFDTGEYVNGFSWGPDIDSREIKSRVRSDVRQSLNSR
ncbi:hypothetical protein BKA82DRAFT_4067714 [Pisolithus tinctorius]|nr:hypothetical protein BKA82DRAFT_4067714 [Pisolithus tinctorius]